MKVKTEIYDLVIIGAGPAGLTAAYELKNTDKNILVVEKKSNVGGLAETKVFGNFRYDIGPHRFFTKNEEINNLFLKILGNDAVSVNRKTRILFNQNYFDYPLTPLNALFGLGFIESTKIGLSYIFSRIKSYIKITKINNFEDWLKDKFGNQLYKNFFKNYTEKVWGIECSSIGADWASQRIKGLSLSTAIKYALFPNSKKRPKTLIDKFYYPKLGAGMLWEKFETIINESKVEIIKNTSVIKIKKENNYFILNLKNSKKQVFSVKTKNIFFSSPLLDFIQFLDDSIPEKVKEAANNLNYRNHLSVHITIDKKLFDDNWIYIHSPDVKLARIADFTNFSKEMSSSGFFPLTLEYFCFESDEIWSKSDEEIIEFGLSELKKIFNHDIKVIHSAVSRNPKAYPVIKIGYQDNLDVIKNWLKIYPEITAIGRSGMFKYNNQDHAMATGMYAAKTFLGLGTYDPWEVNIDGEYHEEISSD